MRSPTHLLRRLLPFGLALVLACQFPLLLRAAEQSAAQSEAPAAQVGGIGTPDKAAHPQLPPEYFEAVRLHEHGKNEEALAIFMQVARKDPRGGPLGRIVASLASQKPPWERIERAIREAEAAPDDPLLQFVAGVGCHYYAHQSAESLEQKRDLYTRCITYLEKVRELYAFEPRIYIYLAVSNFRIGRQEEAEALIEQAVQLDAKDPDAFYCRAEIFQRKDLSRSIQDLDHYLGATKSLTPQQRRNSRNKIQRVEDMRDYLIAIKEGRAQPAELFDPMHADDLPPSFRRETANPWRWFDRDFLILYALIAGVGLLVWRLRARRSPGGPAQ